MIKFLNLLKNSRFHSVCVMCGVQNWRKKLDMSRIREVDDILGLNSIDRLNGRVLASLPIFAVHDISCLPTFKVDYIDVCLLAICVAAIQEQLFFHLNIFI